MTASIYSGIRLDTTPALSAADAVRVFGRETGVEAVPASAAELMILPRPDASYALVYRVSAFAGTELPVLFVNARTGVVELRYDNLKFQKATALLGNGVLVAGGLVPNDVKKVSCALQSSTYLAWDMMRPTTIKTYDLKVTQFHPECNVPCRDAALAARLQAAAVAVFQAFSGQGYARMDFRVAPDGGLAGNAYLAGLITSAANPYFWIWWLSVGSALVLSGLATGLFMAAVFMIGHWGADYGWLTLVSSSLDRGRSIISAKNYRRILGICGSFLVWFGIYFLCAA